MGFEEKIVIFLEFFFQGVLLELLKIKDFVFKNTNISVFAACTAMTEVFDFLILKIIKNPQNLRSPILQIMIFLRIMFWTIQIRIFHISLSIEKRIILFWHISNRRITIFHYITH